MIRQRLLKLCPRLCQPASCALTYMKGFCRAAKSRKVGLIVGTLRIACHGWCTAARFHTTEEHSRCLLRCHDGLDCSRHYNRCPPLFESFCVTGLLHCLSSIRGERTKTKISGDCSRTSTEHATRRWAWRSACTCTLQTLRGYASVFSCASHQVCRLLGTERW